MAKTKDTSSVKKNTQMNVALSPDDIIFLKTYAAQQDTTVAAVIHKWIERAREKQASQK